MYSLLYIRGGTMNAEQKRAWFTVIVFAVCVILYAALAPFIGARAATGAFGLFGFWGLAGFIGRREKPDERDISILRKATMLGFAASYLIFVLGLMSVWFAAFMFHGRSQVSVHVLPAIVGLGAITHYLVRAVATLVGYRLHVEADDV
jgi:hypothetical protein